MTEKNDKVMDRRNFLRGVGGVSTAAVAAVASPLAATDAQAYNPGSEETKARYRETEGKNCPYLHTVFAAVWACGRPRTFGRACVRQEGPRGRRT